MTVRALYRVAALLFVLFAAGHTVGFLRFTPVTPEGRAVQEAMRAVHFPVGRAQFTYDRFYVGFGLFATAYLIFSVILAWQLGNLAERQAVGLAPVAWSFFGTQVASLVVSWVYFFAAPTIFSAAVAACLGVAAWRLTGRRAAVYEGKGTEWQPRSTAG